LYLSKELEGYLIVGLMQPRRKREDMKEIAIN
jgi:hypothetical protein